jgi:CHAT domain/SIR2-like domain
MARRRSPRPAFTPSMVSSTSHADLEVRILSRDQDAGGKFVYRVELTLDQAQEFPGFADLDGLAPWDPSGPETKDQYGERIFERLLPPGDLRTAWDRIRGQNPLRRIRLRIDAQLPQLHRIQWELLRVPGAEPGADVSMLSSTPFSRYLAQDWQPGRAVLKRPIRVLVAVANPSDLEAAYRLEPVDGDAEFKLLQAAAGDIKDADGNPAVQFDLLPAPCTLDAIRDHLKKGYQILHYVGHGMFGRMKDAKGAAADHAALLMPDPANGDAAVRVLDDAIAGMIANLLTDMTRDDEDRLRLVFLESCETARRSSSDAFRGLAPQLVQSGVAAVIAMQDLVEVRTARPFAATFYRQLLQHGLVDLACNEARDAVKTQKLRGAEVPVLFMRLRSGELLRVTGQISGAAVGNFWNRLIANIRSNTCVPFLGSRMNRGILPAQETIALEVARKNGYRLADAHNLARVAQFEAFKDPGAFRATYVDVLKQSLYRTMAPPPAALDRRGMARRSLTELVEVLGWEAISRQIEESNVYDLLADLELPLYVTTNADCFMVQALKAHMNAKAGAAGGQAGEGAEVRRIGPRWEKTTEGAPVHSLLNPEPDNDTPYVLHLNGYEDPADRSQLEHLALSEEDLMAAFVRLSRDQVDVLPSNVLTRLAESSWVFLGYSLDDWEFRLVVQGLLQPIAQSGAKKKLHVGVQLDSASGTGNLSDGEIRNYLQDYLGNRFNITVYWGTPRQFISELHERYTNG